jgi:hypothetical protein
VEGKVKETLRNGIRWIKHTCSRIVHGYWLLILTMYSIIVKLWLYSFPFSK